MKVKRILRNLLILAIVACNIGCDQVTKTIARQQIGDDEQISYLNDHLTILKTENSGAFLSVGDALPVAVKFVLLSLLPLLVIAFGVYTILTKSTLANPLVAGLCFVIGGGIGNLYDRLVHGSVTDFLHMDFILFQTGIFNMADVSIMVGMGLVLWQAFTNRERFGLKVES